MFLYRCICGHLLKKEEFDGLVGGQCELGEWLFFWKEDVDGGKVFVDIYERVIKGENSQG